MNFNLVCWCGEQNKCCICILKEVFINLFSSTTSVLVGTLFKIDSGRQRRNETQQNSTCVFRGSSTTFSSRVSETATEFLDALFQWIVNEFNNNNYAENLLECYKFEVVSIFNCSECNYKREKYETNYHLSLPPATNVSRSINNYFHLDGELIDDCVCPECKIVAKTIRRYEFISFPRVLLIQPIVWITGPGVDNKGHRIMNGQKNDFFLDIESSITITSRGEKKDYILDSCVWHNGISLDDGHYVIFKKKNGNWYLINDGFESISSISEMNSPSKEFKDRFVPVLLTFVSDRNNNAIGKLFFFCVKKFTYFFLFQNMFPLLLLLLHQMKPLQV